MSLREDLWERLPEEVTHVSVSRGTSNGNEAILVGLRFIKDDKPHYLDMAFDQKNKMDAEHMAAVLTSYVRTGGNS